MAPRTKNLTQYDHDAFKRQLDRVIMPEKVKCRVCKKIRQQSAFSNRQLQEVRKRLAVAGGNGISGPGVAACRDCVGGQTVELTCIICDRTKSLESFSKVQRQNPDNARCKICLQSHLDTAPIVDENQYIEHHETNLESGTTASLANEVTSGLRSLRVADGTDPFLSARQNDSRNSDTRSSAGDSVGPGSTNGVTVAGSDIPFTAYDPTGKAYARSVADPGSVTSTTMNSGWEDWGVQSRSEAAVSNARAPRASNNRGFAKVPSARPRGQPVPVQHEEPLEETLDFDDDEDNESNVSDWL